MLSFERLGLGSGLGVGVGVGLGLGLGFGLGLGLGLGLGFDHSADALLRALYLEGAIGEGEGLRLRVAPEQAREEIGRETRLHRAALGLASVAEDVMLARVPVKVNEEYNLAVLLQ